MPKDWHNRKRAGDPAMLRRALKNKKVQGVLAALVLAGLVAVGVPAPVATLIGEAAVEVLETELDQPETEATTEE